MIDSHAHVYADDFTKDLNEVIQRAKDQGINKILLPNIDTGSIDAMKTVVEQYPNYAYPMMGLHPCSVKANVTDELTKIKIALDTGYYIAVGEIGIDLYWDQSTRDLQIDAFLEQCRWAVERNLPIVIHSRESIDLILGLLETHYPNGIQGVFHCFTGDLKQVERIMDLGMYVGLGGVLTFKNSKLKEIVPQIPLDRIVLETDSPYLAPTPHRGKRNEPAYTALVQEFLSELLGIPFETLDGILEANTLRLFKI